MLRHRHLTVMLVMLLAAPAYSPTVQSAGQPGPVKPAALDPEFMGMVIRDPWYDFGTYPGSPNEPNKAFQDTMGATLAQAGVRWVRLDFHIFGNDAEREIAKNDYFITTVAPRHGFKILALLSFDLLMGVEPRLLNTGPFTVTQRFGGGVNQYMDTWLTRALLIADRYGDQIAAYEILNEQNRLPQTTPNGPSGDGIDPKIVGRLITKFYRFCKGIQPLPSNEPEHGCRNASIILGGLHPRGTSNAKGEVVLTDTEYLRAIYEDQDSFAGFKKDHHYFPVDGIGYHPYPEEIRLSPNDAIVDRGANRMRKELERVGDACKPFWVTEIGYNVGFDVDGPKGKTPAQTEYGQMLFLQDVYTSLAQRRICSIIPEVATVFWFKYEDFPPADGPAAQRWGIVRIPFTIDSKCPGGACYDVAGRPALYRPAYFAYRELAGLPIYRAYMPVVRRPK